MKILAPLLSALLFFTTLQRANADFDLIIDTSNGDRVLRLTTDVAGTIDKTTIDINEAGNAIEFVVEEYIGEALVNEQTVLQNLDDFDSVEVISGLACRLNLYSSVSQRTVLVYGSNLNDYLDGAEEIHGMDGADRIYRAEYATGGAGDDLISGCRSAKGDSGDDIMHAIDDFSGSELEGNAGQDWLVGYRGLDYLNGGDGDDALFGGPGDDRLVGGKGFDTIYGYLGNDTMDPGDDSEGIASENGEILNGQQGADVFLRYTVSGSTINTWDDFRSWEGDSYDGITIGSLWNYNFYNFNYGYTLSGFGF